MFVSSWPADPLELKLASADEVRTSHHGLPMIKELLPWVTVA
jgi:hypothetical protein